MASMCRPDADAGVPARQGRQSKVTADADREAGDRDEGNKGEAAAWIVLCATEWVSREEYPKGPDGVTLATLMSLSQMRLRTTVDRERLWTAGRRRCDTCSRLFSSECCWRCGRSG